MPRLTDSQIQNYVDTAFSRCPYCGERETTCEPLQPDGKTATADCFCKECGAEWQELWTLTTIIQEGD